MKTRALLMILLSTFLLQGCITAAVVGTAAVATKTTVDPRTTGTQVDDTTLEIRVTNALSKNSELKGHARILAVAYQGKVLLIGQAPDQQLRQLAQKTALGVNGISEVYNEIRIGKLITLGTISNDTWITTKVRSQFLTNNLIRSANFKVVTENSEVFLLGIATEQESETAAQVTSRVKGVKRVTTAFVIN